MNPPPWQTVKSGAISTKVIFFVLLPITFVADVALTIFAAITASDGRL